MNHLLRRSAAPAVACLFSSSIYQTQHGKNQSYDSVVRCDESVNVQKIQIQKPKQEEKSESTKAVLSKETGMDLKPLQAKVTEIPSMHKQEEEAKGEEEKKEKEEEEGPLFHNLFPLRQLWKPTLEYPLWDENWDSRQMKPTGDNDKDRETKRFVRKNGVTKHIILIRHGQYDETHKEDEKRLLTPLGRKQAELTGKRLAKMIEGFDEKFGPCNVKTIRVSNMARAKETADIIAQNIPGGTLLQTEPDANLNEGRPCHHIPGGKASKRTVQKTDETHERIETAFKTYFYRADPPSMNDNQEEKQSVISENESKGIDDEEEDMSLKPHPQHEFEIIVCHANVIRYFLCRALQIPPEAWLRLCTFNCSLTYLTIRATGTVSCRMLGDIGHLGHEHSTFSMHHGFNW